VDVICDDFDVDTTVPSSNVTYDYSTIGGPAWATNVAFQSGETIVNTSGAAIGGTANNGTLALTETQAYDTAAVLLVTLSKMNSPTANQITDYQYALWNLFDSHVALNATQVTDQFTAADIVTSGIVANQVATAADAAKLVIYTAVPTNSSQEFLGLGTPTPEPGAWVFAAGLALLFLSPRFRSRIRAAKLRA
jgi:hypothetical protein